MSSVSSSYTSQDIARIEDMVRREAEKAREHNDKQVEQLEKKFQQDRQKIEEDSSKTVDRIRETADQSYTRQKNEYTDSLEQLKEKLYDSNGRMSGPSAYDVYKTQVENLEKQHEEARKADQNSIDHYKELNHEIEKNAQERNRSEIENLKNEHLTQTADLRKNVNDLNEYHTQAAKQQGQVIERLEREFDNGPKMEQQRLQNTYEDIIKRMKEDIQHREALDTGKTNETLEAKDRYWTNIVGRQKAEDHEANRLTEMQFDKQRSQIEEEKKRDQQRMSELTEQSIEAINQSHNDTFAKQSAQFSRTLNEQKKQNDTELKLVQEALQQQRTSANTDAIAPAAEANLRKSIVKEYEKSLTTETNRNKENNQRLLERETEAYQSALREFNNRDELTNRQNATQRTLETRMYTDMMDQLASDGENRFYTQEKMNDRSRDQLMRQFSAALELQRQTLEHDFRMQRDDAMTKLANFQQDAQINMRVAQRTFTREQNELLRDYEKKLADQKAEHEIEIENLRFTKQTEMRDLERRLRQDYESQTRGYEQRIAQAEAQSKERERLITQNFQDELDKVRRSHELASKKKS